MRSYDMAFPTNQDWIERSIGESASEAKELSRCGNDLWSTFTRGGEGRYSRCQSPLVAVVSVVLLTVAVFLSLSFSRYHCSLVVLFWREFDSYILFDHVLIQGLEYQML